MALSSMLVRRSLNRCLSSISNQFLNLNGSSPLMLRSAAPSSQNQNQQISCFRTSVARASSRNGSSFSNQNQQDESIGPDTILFEGCDYNHWLITMDFPKDPEPTPQQMVETYVQTLAQVVGSVEEAKRRMYACSTTTYRGFQAVMTEEMSDKFKGLPGVVFILPDSYIDPVNKEYGGDKYDNGVITHRPPPHQYRQRYTADRRPRNPHPVQNAPPPQHTYAPQHNYAPNQGPPANNNYAPNQRSNAYPTQTNPIPPYQRGSSQVGARDYGQPDNRDFRGDNTNIGSSYDANYRQEPGTGFSHRDNMQGQQNFPPMGHTRNDQGGY